MLDNLPRLWYHITIKFRANRVRLCCCAGRFKTGCRCEEFHRRASNEFGDVHFTQNSLASREKASGEDAQHTRCRKASKI